MMDKKDNLYLWVVVLTALLLVVSLVSYLFSLTPQQGAYIPGGQLPGGTCAYTGCYPRVIYEHPMQVMLSSMGVYLPSLVLGIMGCAVVFFVQRFIKEMDIGFYY